MLTHIPQNASGHIPPVLAAASSESVAHVEFDLAANLLCVLTCMVGLAWASSFAHSRVLRCDECIPHRTERTLIPGKEHAYAVHCLAESVAAAGTDDARASERASVQAAACARAFRRNIWYANTRRLRDACEERGGATRRRRTGWNALHQGRWADGEPSRLDERRAGYV